MKTIQLAKAGASLNSVADQIQTDADAVIVEREDGCPLILITLAEYNGLIETAHLLSSPRNAAHLAKSIAQAQEGKFHQVDLSDLDDADAQPPVHS